MSVLSTIRKARRASYRFGSVSGDVVAGLRAIEEGKPDAIIKRVARKGTLRKVGGLMTKVFGR